MFYYKNIRSIRRCFFIKREYNEDFIYRENKQWEGSRIMLVEHVEAIRKAQKKDLYIEKHILDDQELEEIGIVAMESLSYTLPVKLTYWNDGEYLEVCGTVTKADRKQIRLECLDEVVIYVWVDCIKYMERHQ